MGSWIGGLEVNRWGIHGDLLESADISTAAAAAILMLVVVVVRAVRRWKTTLGWDRL